MLAICGPTGTGKSETAALAAERIDGEIIGCDALQVYRGFDRATAKPDAETRRRVPHHLIDTVDPRVVDYSLADYVRDAEQHVRQILDRGRVPVVVGGTGMYLRGLLRGVVAAPPRDPVLRDRLRGLAARFGPARLHRWLRGVDPPTAGRLHPGDTQRILRALEIALKGEGTWSETLRERGTWAGGGERYRTLKIGLDMDRDALARRIDRRVAAFFEAGLVDEVRGLLESNVPREANAFKAIGYREVVSALADSDADPPIDRLVDDVRRNTRRYAKRQRTWFRKEPNVVWLDAAEGPEALADRIEAEWRRESA